MKKIILFIFLKTKIDKLNSKPRYGCRTEAKWQQMKLISAMKNAITRQRSLLISLRNILTSSTSESLDFMKIESYLCEAEILNNYFDQKLIL